MSDQILVTRDELTKAIQNAYRNGASDERQRVGAVLYGVLASRANVSPVYSQTIGIKEAIRILGVENV
jgi:hypothetical protein